MTAAVTAWVRCGQTTSECGRPIYCSSLITSGETSSWSGHREELSSLRAAIQAREVGPRGPKATPPKSAGHWPCRKIVRRKSVKVWEIRLQAG